MAPAPAPTGPRRTRRRPVSGAGAARDRRRRPPRRPRRAGRGRRRARSRTPASPRLEHVGGQQDPTCADRSRPGSKAERRQEPGAEGVADPGGSSASSLGGAGTCTVGCRPLDQRALPAQRGDPDPDPLQQVRVVPAGLRHEQRLLVLVGEQVAPRPRRASASGRRPFGPTAGRGPPRRAAPGPGLLGVPDHRRRGRSGRRPPGRPRRAGRPSGRARSSRASAIAPV